MSKNRQNYNRPSFLRNHADTVAIIGVNLAIAAMLLSLIISNMHRVDAVNSRSDYLHQRLEDSRQALIELIREGRK